MSSKYFQHAYLLGRENGYLVVVGVRNYGYTVTDTSDFQGDDTTQLGDIDGDGYSALDTFDISQDGSYIGKAQYGFVGAYGGENDILFTEHTYALGEKISYLPGQQADPTTWYNLACFSTGTRISTVTGHVAVEALHIGDLVVTASGTARPVKWIGTRSYAKRFVANNRDLLPICFKAGSISDNVPSRDLYVSPKHAMFFDGVLIPAEELLNGVSIVRAVTVEDLAYWHVELDTHDVLLAEGAPSESYVEDGNRGMFQNAHECAADSSVDAVYCAPRVVEGSALQTVRDRLAARVAIGRGTVAA